MKLQITHTQNIIALCGSDFKGFLMTSNHQRSCEFWEKLRGCLQQRVIQNSVNIKNSLPNNSGTQHLCRAVEGILIRREGRGIEVGCDEGDWKELAHSIDPSSYFVLQSKSSRYLLK